MYMIQMGSDFFCEKVDKSFCTYQLNVKKRLGQSLRNGLAIILLIDIEFGSNFWIQERYSSFMSLFLYMCIV